MSRDPDVVRRTCLSSPVLRELLERWPGRFTVGEMRVLYANVNSRIPTVLEDPWQVQVWDLTKPAGGSRRCNLDVDSVRAAEFGHVMGSTERPLAWEVMMSMHLTFPMTLIDDAVEAIVFRSGRERQTFVDRMADLAAVALGLPDDPSAPCEVAPIGRPVSDAEIGLARLPARVYEIPAMIYGAPVVMHGTSTPRPPVPEALPAPHPTSPPSSSSRRRRFRFADDDPLDGD